MDEFMLAAMREVDEMLPDSPPIAPPKTWEEERTYANALSIGQQTYNAAAAANDQQRMMVMALGARNVVNDGQFVEVACEPRDLQAVFGAGGRNPWRY